MCHNARYRYTLTMSSLVCLGVMASSFGLAMATANTASAASGTPPLAYVLNTNDGTLSLIDTVTDTTEGSPIAVGSPGYRIALTPDGKFGYFSDSTDNTVSVLDTATNSLVGSPILDGAGPSGTTPFGIAISPDGSIAYVDDEGTNTVIMIDTATNTVVGNPIPAGPDPTDIAVSPDGNTVYVTDQGAPTVSVINAVTDSLAGQITVGNNPFGIAITPDGKMIYVLNRGDGTVSVIDATTEAVIGTIDVGVSPYRIAITPDGQTAYVANSGSGFVSVIDTTTNTNVASIPVGEPSGEDSDGIAITPDGQTVLVTSVLNDGTANSFVYSIDTATNSVVAGPTPVGRNADDIVVAPDQAPQAALSIVPGLASGPATQGTSATFVPTSHLVTLDASPSRASSSPVAGEPVTLDASASIAPSSPITSYAWNFGDGQLASGSSATITHTYASPGTYKGTVTETDAAGTSTTQVFTGKTMSRDGGPSAVASQTFTVNNPPPSTAVVIPSTGASVQGASALLGAVASASNGVKISKVQFVITGGSYSQTVVGTATPTIYGYLDSWNTTSVPDGTYTLQSLATDAAGNSAYSSGIAITVNNPPPSTAVVIPSTGASVQGASALLGAVASASNGVKISKVQFVITGGSYSQTVVGTATPTIYGYLDSWNTTSVPTAPTRCRAWPPTPRATAPTAAGSPSL